MKKLMIPLLCFFSFTLPAQSEVLTAYVAEGLKNNEAIRQQNFSLEKATLALKEAYGLFAPNINLQTSYVASKGGRTIDLPIGDLMNPVYSNLNQINQLLAPGAPSYPQISNVSEQLNPNNFYNAYFRTTMPLLNAELWYNKNIKKEEIGLREAQLAVYRRELAKDIQAAYYQYLKATNGVEIYRVALELLQESERINARLVENGKEVPFALARIKSEISKTEALQTELEYQRKNAAAYFNFLINKPLDAAIDADPALLNRLLPLPNHELSQPGKREELLQLAGALRINQQVMRLQNAAWIPKLGAQLDLGAQGFDFKVNRQSAYYLLGVSFDWNLFSGWRNMYKRKQTALDIKTWESKYTQAEQQLKLSSLSASNSYVSAVQQYRKSADREKSAEEYFRLTERKYREGMAMYIEYLDARNEKTFAQLQRNMAYYDAWIRWAELERAQATFPITNK